MANGQPPVDTAALLQQIADQQLQTIGQQGQLRSQPQPQQPRGLLAPGQQGFTDAVTNPSQGQLEAAIAGLASAANPDTASPLLAGAVGGLSALQQRRQQTLQERRQTFQQENEALQQRLENLGRVRTSLSQAGEADRSERRLEGQQANVLSPEEAEQLSPGLGQAIESGQAVVERRGNGQIDVTSIPGRSQTQNDRKVQALIEQGVDENRAKNIVYGFEKTRQNPVTGRIETINVIDRNAEEIATGQPIELEDQQPGTGIFSRVKDATGLRSGLLSATARLPGTEATDAEEAVLAARTELNLVQNEVASALVTSPHLPVRERELVEDSLDIRPKLFDNPSAMEARMIASDRFLRRKFEDAKAVAENSTFADKDRGDAAMNAATIKAVIEQLNVPRGAMLQQATPDDVKAFNKEDLRIMQRTLTEEDIENMPTPVLETLLDRFEKMGLE